MERILQSQFVNKMETNNQNNTRNTDTDITISPEMLAELRKKERYIELEEKKEQMRDKDVWERHGFESELGSKILNGYIYVMFSFIIFGLFLVPVVLVLIPVSLFIDWLSPFPIVFPYNLFFQLPIGCYVLWRSWKFCEEND